MIGHWNTTPANSLASVNADRDLCEDLCLAIDGEPVAMPSNGTLPDGRLMAQSAVAAKKHGLSAEGQSLVKLIEHVRRHLDEKDWNTTNAEIVVHLDTHPCLPAATVMVILQPQTDGDPT